MSDNLPINYAEQLAKEAEAIGARIASPSGDRIRFDGNRALIAPDGTEGTELEVVIVEFISSNLFYDGQFDRNNPQPPGCFALGPEPSELVPSPNSPNRQSDNCALCPNNQFGSAGKGKACKNTRLLAVMPVAMDGETPPVWIMSIPPTSLKSFDGYVKTLSVKHKTVPIGVVTKISLDNSVSFAAPRFEVVRPLAAEEFKTYMEQRSVAMDRLLTEPDVTGYAARPSGPARVAPRGRVR